MISFKPSLFLNLDARNLRQWLRWLTAGRESELRQWWIVVASPRREEEGGGGRRREREAKVRRKRGGKGGNTGAIEELSDRLSE
eukprot:1283208-Rhodomonas_salina.1